MGVRRRSRELALQILFQKEFQEGMNFEQILALYRESFDSEPELWEYAKLIVQGVMEEKNNIDDLIQSSSARWKLDRMAIVDRNILRIAVFELRFLDREIPTTVAINEAIEIAKRYGSTDSKSFINGILDNISKL